MTDGAFESHGDEKYLAEQWRPESGVKNDGDVLWLNDIIDMNKDAQLTYTAYGKDAAPAVLYSFCGILIGVPPYGEDGRMAVEKIYANYEDDREWR
ncbi:hypothetical protein B0H63DRAFT_528125 [Podospora didyma]|uniref:Uncharacterized protein n=1 Tax=Podospora didyma TaxID=330526 RepID=A0AAE0K5E1_9PEZI|nr:hypothetical protein B0H63DRAFT_528125 [Podospora didyma]